MALDIAPNGLVLPRRVGSPDGPTTGQARGPLWRRVAPGQYVPADTLRSTRQRILEAASGVPDGCGVTGWAALHWQGSPWFEGLNRDGTELPVQVAIGDSPGPRRREGVQFWRDWLFEGDLVEVDGITLTRPERSACMAALRVRTFEEAVQVMDMSLNSGLVELPSLLTYADRLRGRPGTRRLRSALLHARENVWSPMESAMRLEWWVARPGAPLLCNTPVLDPDGRHLLTPDLFDPEAGVAGEYDGVIHDSLQVRRRDLDREERARAAGIEVVSMNSTDLRDRGSFIHRLLAAYHRSSGPTGLWVPAYQSKVL